MKSVRIKRESTKKAVNVLKKAHIIDARYNAREQALRIDIEDLPMNAHSAQLFGMIQYYIGYGRQVVMDSYAKMQGKKLRIYIFAYINQQIGMKNVISNIERLGLKMNVDWKNTNPVLRQQVQEYQINSSLHGNPLKRKRDDVKQEKIDINYNVSKVRKRAKKVEIEIKTKPFSTSAIMFYGDLMMHLGFCHLIEGAVEQELAMEEWLLSISEKSSLFEIIISGKLKHWAKAKETVGSRVRFMQKKLEGYEFRMKIV